MVRLPAGWAKSFHPQAARPSRNQLVYRPGWRGSGMQRMAAPGIEAYTGVASGIPLTGGQAQGTVPASGDVSVAVGPQGIGTVWYPVQVTLTTSAGVLDTSTALVYLGPAGFGAGSPGVVQVGQLYSGNGTVALAIPDMTPGQVLTAAWSGATQTDLVTMNVIGTMDCLTTG